MEQVRPDLQWYRKTSTEAKVLPRCPFASVDDCPRYYQSLALMSELGSTAIDPEKDRALEARWSRSPLWPVTAEQVPTVSGRQHLMNFCPEVVYDRFGWFCSSLADYADELDRDMAHAALHRHGGDARDPGWQWQSLRPMHYTECPLYSPLMHSQARHGGDKGEKGEEILSVRPGAFGLTLNVNALVRRALRWWRERGRGALRASAS